MKRILATVGTGALIAIMAVACSASGPPVVDNSGPPSGSFPSTTQYQTELGVGMDVDWSKTSRDSTAFTAATAQDAKAIGLNSVRIRVTAQPSSSLLHGLDTQIADSVNAGLVPVLAYQAEAFKKHPSEAELDQAVAWWKTVSTHFAKASPELSFDLIIEVTDALSKQPAMLNSFYDKAVSAIRATNPTRILLISPVQRSSPLELHTLAIPAQADHHLMVEWHFYAAGPSPTGTTKTWTTGTRRRSG